MRPATLGGLVMVEAPMQGGAHRCRCCCLRRRCAGSLLAVCWGAGGGQPRSLCLCLVCLVGSPGCLLANRLWSARVGHQPGHNADHAAIKKNIAVQCMIRQRL